MDKQKVYEDLLQTIEEKHNFSDSIVNWHIENGDMRAKAIRLLEQDIDISTLSEEELEKEVAENIEFLIATLRRILQDKNEALKLFDITSELHGTVKIVNTNLANNIEDPVSALINLHINSNKPDKVQALLTAFKCIDLENENKRITLTDEQYRTWLETDIMHINTEQFEILYGITQRKQADLRSTKNFLPSFQIDGKGKHYYNKKEVENWLSNYKRQRHF